MAFIGVPIASLSRPVTSFLRSTRPQSMRTVRRFTLRPHGASFLRMSSNPVPLPKDAKEMNDGDWKGVLSPRAFNVLRQGGTEPGGTGEYDGFYPDEGHFVCGGCSAPLYSAEAKFKSGCGWPAFDKCYKGAVNTNVDTSFGMRRVEIVCGNCDGHLGHVFEGERLTDTNERHCVNSLSVRYNKGTMEKEEAKVV